VWGLAQPRSPPNPHPHAARGTRHHQQPARPRAPQAAAGAEDPAQLAAALAGARGEASRLRAALAEAEVSQRELAELQLALAEAERARAAAAQEVQELRDSARGAGAVSFGAAFAEGAPD
jgi:hypothetical protein